MMWASTSLLPALVSFRLLNRGEARLVDHDPDAEVQRNRRKAGLRPLVSFRTIEADASALGYIAPCEA